MSAKQQQSASTAKLKTLVVGSSGLVGSVFVSHWKPSNTGDELHVLGRRDAGESSNGIAHVAPIEDWQDTIAAIAPDIVFCALGTTIAKAGSKKAFRAVDLDLVADVAAAAKQAGARQFILISSTMANVKASGFYVRTKGEAEAAVEEQQFERLDIIRPGLLRGDRKEFRAGERVAILLSPVMDCFLQGSLRKYRSVAAATVADTALSLVSAPVPGRFIHEALT
ncbi:MAG: NAD-dependent epimerase/dehydratase family protein [Halioglobus sp.]